MPATLLELVEQGRVFCAWYALCENIAVDLRPHPILGDVPICDRCDHKADRDGA